MGLEDRDYARDYESGFQLRAPQSTVGLLIAINVGVFLLDVILQGRISERAELSATLFSQPWDVWQLITYGFLHSTDDLFHILFNMLFLFFLGRELEQMYGRWEFLRIYLAAVVVGGLLWVASQTFVHRHTNASLVGASSAVCCVVVLFALHFPRRMLLFFGFIPVPAWAIGAFYVVTNMLGALGARGDGTAYEAHLGGIAVGLAYYRFNWNFGRWLPESVNLGTLPRRNSLRRPKLKLHQPQDEAAPVNMEAEVDRILAKIHDSGQDSLTDAERKLLERASARYQRRRQ